MKSPTYSAAIEGRVVQLTLLPKAEWRDSEIGNAPVIVSKPAASSEIRAAMKAAMHQLMYELGAGDPPQTWEVSI